MAQELITLLAIISPLAALVFGYFSFNHTRKKTEKEETTQMITVINKLENIGETVRDIKSDISGVKNSVSTLYERLAKVEARLETIDKA